MKVSRKISTSYGLMSGLTMVAIGIVVYTASSFSWKKVFYEKLSYRVDLAEKIYLEKDTLRVATYNLLRGEFAKFLPEEEEDTIRVVPGWEKIMESYPDGFVDDLKEDNIAFAEYDDRQMAGKIFKFAQGDYVVVVSAVNETGLLALSNLRNILVVCVLAGSIILALTGQYLSNRHLKPISDKIKKADRIGAGNLHERLKVFKTSDEIEMLAMSFNRLLDRLETAFNGQKAFIANASHEIKNPLTVIVGEADWALEKERSNDEYQQALAAIREKGEELDRLIAGLLQLATISYRPENFGKEKLAVEEILLETQSRFIAFRPDSNVCFCGPEKHPATGLVFGNRELLISALSNLLDNAHKFSSGKEVRIEVTIGSGTVSFEIVDHGIGIAGAELDQIKQPFFRSDNARSFKGTGIGISLVSQIAEFHSGRLEFKSEAGAGTRARFTIPFC